MWLYKTDANGFKIRNSRNIGMRLAEKEPHTVEWLKSGSGVFYDIGACIGSYTLLAASLGYNVYAFEPLNVNYKALLKNLKKNGLQAHVFNFALGEKIKDAFLRDRAMGQSSRISGAGQPTKVWDLDSFVKEFNILPPDYVKIDTDGYEPKILAGGKETLKHAKSIQVESKENLCPEGFKIAHKFSKLTSDLYDWQFEK